MTAEIPGTPGGAGVPATPGVPGAAGAPGLSGPPEALSVPNEFDVVAGDPTETELAALVAVGTAVQSVNALLETGEEPGQPVPGTVAQCSEWTSRGRRGAMRSAGMAVPGTYSDAWRWSLHP